MSAGRSARNRRRTVYATAGVAALAAGVMFGAGAVGAAGSPLHPATSQPKPTGTAHAAKSITGRLAQTDPAVLKLTGSIPTSVMVKLDYDALASYTGTIHGYAATSPDVTGKPLNPRSAASTAYLHYVNGVQSTFVGALHQAVPSAATGMAYQGVYGGIEVKVPANQVSKLLSLPGVAAVQADSLHKLDATQVNDDDASFIGAQAAYNALGSSATAGKGVIIADVDTGVWPEHPSFANRSDLTAPPPTSDNHPRACNFGGDPTAAVQPAPAFQCNDKLIEGRVFLDTYNAFNNDELYPTTARDSNGHGTHTTSTSGGNPIAHPILLGIDRGPIQGIAPGAWLMSYKALGPQGGYDSDLVGAIEQAIYDGANVINYSIGPDSPQSAYTSPDDLAFLDAFDAGVVASTSAGNSGPGPQTVAHEGAWELSTGATTLQRAFTSTATLNSSDAASLSVTGSSIMPGISTATPVVSAAAPPYSDARCQTPAAPGTFTGEIVICVRGVNGRVEKGFNVAQGNAAGMFLVNPVVEDTETDNHFLPAVHFDKPAGDQIQAFLAAHPNVTATFTTGVKSTGQGDVMAAFSSRGPGSDGFLKPDIAAPGVQILAGNTPTPTDVASGPAGQFYQAIAGTSMAAPHITGSTALVQALHPGLSAAEVMSILMTTATTSVVEQDGSTPATPFDDGAGRVDLNNVVNPGLALNVTPAQMDNSITDPLHRIDLNTSSVYDGALPGRVTTTRSFTNLTSKSLTYNISVKSGLADGIVVSPSTLTLGAHKTKSVSITLNATKGTVGQTYFGEIDLTPTKGAQRQHLPVAFTVSDASGAGTPVSVTSNCSPSSIVVNSGRTTCSATVVNNSFQATTASATLTPSANLQLTAVGTGGKRSGFSAKYGPVSLSAATPPTPNAAAGSSPFGFFDLANFGLTPTPIGDEAVANFAIPQFVYDGQTYATIGVVSDGYVVVGGGDDHDVTAVPQTMPDPGRPNNVLAPLWTDLDDGGGNIPGEGVTVADLSDGVNSWTVVQWTTHVFAAPGITEQFQLWIGTNGTQDISYTYNTVNDPGVAFTVGAENAEGSAGNSLSGLPVPGNDVVVTSGAAVPGGSATFSATLHGVTAGTGTATWSVTSPSMRDTAISRSTVHITRS